MQLSFYDLVDGLRGQMNSKCLNFGDDMDSAMDELADFANAADELGAKHADLLKIAQQAGLDTFMHGDALDTFERQKDRAATALRLVQPERVF